MRSIGLLFFDSVFPAQLPFSQVSASQCGTGRASAHLPVEGGPFLPQIPQITLFPRLLRSAPLYCPPFFVFNAAPPPNPPSFTGRYAVAFFLVAFLTGVGLPWLPAGQIFLGKETSMVVIFLILCRFPVPSSRINTRVQPLILTHRIRDSSTHPRRRGRLGRLVFLGLNTLPIGHVIPIFYPTSLHFPLLPSLSERHFPVFCTCVILL